MFHAEKTLLSEMSVYGAFRSLRRYAALLAIPAAAFAQSPLIYQPINGPTISAQPGQTMILWGTGLGAVPDDTVAPTAGNLAAKVEVFVGGVSAQVTYSGRTPCCAGTDQIVFTIPQNAPLGCWVPVFVRTNGTTLSNAVTIGIGSGSTCSDPQNPISAALVQGGKLGGFAAVQRSTHEDVGVKTPVDVTADYQQIPIWPRTPAIPPNRMSSRWDI